MAPTAVAAAATTTSEGATAAAENPLVRLKQLIDGDAADEVKQRLTHGRAGFGDPKPWFDSRTHHQTRSRRFLAEPRQGLRAVYTLRVEPGADCRTAEPGADGVMLAPSGAKLGLLT